ncbi:repeat-companion domain protein [Isosphaera pallida ATCC 43644]|uniref:Repeat-companion domain protein n=1 Tax=Isosphaera pallida (strain ATCC 43644 / DSM 9630 / IS1B) TaxID=575540 RepID=E8QZH3_ISOPI|nr:TIGR02996 domain-containing protein [Isosphaera pallida]ADV61100.1 repeat-companion domain protein [Isosphaera pallida ATCC 43644]
MSMSAPTSPSTNHDAEEWRDHAFFTNAIAVGGDDPVPSLIYADWLEELGNSEAAELIRLQVEFEGLERQTPHRDAIEERVGLLTAHQAQVWQSRLGAQASCVEVKRFVRGLPRAARIRADRIDPATLEWLMAVAPIDAFELVHLDEPSAERLAAWPLLGRIRDLTVVDSQRDRDSWALGRLLSSPHLSHLRGLCCSFGRLWPSLGLSLSNLPHLRRLILSTDPAGGVGSVGDTGLIRLIEEGHLKSIEHLAIRHEQIGPRGAQSLAASPTVAGLRSLDLSHNHLGDRGLQELGGSVHLSGLTELIVRDNGIGDDGVSHLANSSHLYNLERLDLAINLVGDIGLRDLAYSQVVRRLKVVDLRRNGITAAIRPMFRRRAEGNTWRDLELGSNRIGPVGAQTLADWPVVANLKRIGLDHNPLGRQACDAIRSLSDGSPSIPGGFEGGPKVGSSVLARLILGGRTANLDELDLRHCGFDDHEAAALINDQTRRIALGEPSPHARQVRLEGNPFSDSLRARLRDLFGPGLRV